MSVERTNLEGWFTAAGSTEARQAPIVAVGDPVEWVKSGHDLPRTSELMLVGFADLTETFLQLHAPSIIVSPVLARHFDCIDLAHHLSRIGYRGQYRAVSGDMPSPEIIEREIRQLCPGMDFAVVAEV